MINVRLSMMAMPISTLTACSEFCAMILPKASRLSKSLRHSKTFEPPGVTPPCGDCISLDLLPIYPQLPCRAISPLHSNVLDSARSIRTCSLFHRQHSKSSLCLHLPTVASSSMSVPFIASSGSFGFCPFLLRSSLCRMVVEIGLVSQ
jgi:hypothetical protein